ncbi:hypothetical protein FRB90_010249, partial [Tulasnella sp. 427]
DFVAIAPESEYRRHGASVTSSKIVNSSSETQLVSSSSLGANLSYENLAMAVWGLTEPAEAGSSSSLVDLNQSTSGGSSMGAGAKSSRKQREAVTREQKEGLKEG